MMPLSRLDCPLSLETAHMGNTGCRYPKWLGIYMRIIYTLKPAKYWAFGFAASCTASVHVCG